MNQLFAAYARGKEAKELVAILGRRGAVGRRISSTQSSPRRSRKRYVSQGYDTNRSIEETLNLGWELLKILPRSELKRIRDDMLDKYMGPAEGDE